MSSIRRQLTLGVMAAVVVLYGLAALFCYLLTTRMVRRDFDARLQRDERKTRRERDQQPHHETAGGKDDKRGHATDRRDQYE